MGAGFISLAIVLWGCSSVVEHVPFKHRADGSIPSTLILRHSRLNAPLAQLVEQLTLNQRALGSSPRWCILISGLFTVNLT